MPFFSRRLPSSGQLFFAASAVVTWLPLYVFINDNGFQLMTVSGPSMYPFLNRDFHSSTARTRVLVDMMNPYQNVRRGSVVAFWSPQDPETTIVKRVVAVEGDEVLTKPPYPVARAIVPPGHVWVEADNPDERRRLDSNTYGPISRNLLVGQLRAIVWPLGQARWVSWRDYRGSPRVIRDAHPVVKTELY